MSTPNIAAGTIRSRRGRRRRRRRQRHLPILLFLLILFCLIGIAVFMLSGLKKSYSTSKRYPRFMKTGDLPLMTEDLAVIDPQEEYDASVTSSEAGIVLNTTDKTVVYSKNPYERLYPASLTKVMTALLVFEKGGLDETVEVTKDAVITENGASLAGIKPGDQITVRELLYGLLLPSGNDAANALAVYTSGSVDAFVGEMNRKAASLGCAGTHFVNTNGLSDDQHYTTAYDFCLIFQKALEYPEFREIISTRQHVGNWISSDGTGMAKTWDNSNWYLTKKAASPKGVTVIGGKTGTTRAAGSCLVMASENEEEKEFISIVLKSENHDTLYQNMTNMIGKIKE